MYHSVPAPNSGGDAVSRHAPFGVAIRLFARSCFLLANGCALAITIWATRRGLRPLWFVGAALLALTVVKLFLFDLSHVTGIERIVSFIGIGVLLLLIGYFSPLPPKAAAQQDGQP